ncbi:MAG: fumarylacetoacetate hydrolase family protein [Arenicellales bacterium]|jgi:fumarylacetoacetate (FAA) hydrolase|nr:fumarylacetoacetate hydrolase family protein [Arenicellales bacterium]MDP7192650.1 fumarylacetoacetate hydrolase family protein [Arenicellales bacterium]MDP7569320.1 fumarylacetoacetate hydrolase family protein [Arenicellales bacterium]MEE1566364.1 fumarylacetoacetate hydrolase family protein [Arenicellales bacterium]HJL57093.1 fumarylacetoacetate hydrolase family protein [Arenicellales bacterium]
MKLATLKSDHPDGRLAVVSRDLARYVTTPDIAPSLQAAMDDWAVAAPLLEGISNALNNGELDDACPLDTTLLASPLPRAYQWVDGSAYVNHVELVRRARGAKMPAHFWTDPLMYQGGSDSFLGPCDGIPVIDTAWGVDFEAEVAVITGRVAMGSTEDQAAAKIRLLMLVNDVSLRNLIPAELAKGFGFFHAKPASAFSPVAVTPDELELAWDSRKIHLPILSELNGTLFGRPDAGVDMTFDFAQLISHAAHTRELGPGTIVGSGTVSNKQNTEHGSAIADGGVGYSCIAELRMIETINMGKPSTSFMSFGDRIRIEMKDQAGLSIFGAIDQRIVEYRNP